jgi:hypothetical protein
MSIDRKELIGFIACLGVFLPLFGQSISFGVHNRVLSFLMVILAAFMTVKYLKSYGFGKYHILYFFLVFVLLGLELLYSDSDQIDNLLLFNYTNDSYYLNKLTMTYFVLIIPFISFFFVAPISLENGFIDGFLKGFFVLTILVIWVSYNSSEYWFVDDYALKKEYMDNDKKFSQINVTILHLLGVFLSIYYFSEKKYIYALPLFLISSIFIIVYQQRSAWVYLFFSFLMFSFLQGNILKFIKYLSIFIIIGFSVYFIGMEVGVFTDSVLRYGDQIFSGELLSSRTDSYERAWNGFLENPIGNGYASYSIYNPYRYPHNIILESLFEMGFFSSFILINILFFSLITMARCFYIMKVHNDTRYLTIGLLIGYMLLISLKSGDLASTERLFVPTLLFMGVISKKYINRRA